MVNDSLLIHQLGNISKFDVKHDSPELKISVSFDSSCGDSLSIFLDTSSGIVKNALFIHSGCILSKAVTNAILLSIDNKSKDFAINLLEQFIYSFQNNAFDIDLGSNSQNTLTPNLLLFKKFINYPSRKDCVLIPAQIIKNLLIKNN